jgi:hypothetical protein
MKSMSDFIFSETKKEMARFTNLRVQLEGLMTFFYGKKRLEEFKIRMKGPRLPSFINSKTEEERVEIEQKIDNLLVVYDKFIKERKEVKEAFKQYKNNKNETDK